MIRTKMQIVIGGTIVTTSLHFTYNEEKACYFESNLNRDFSIKQVKDLTNQLKSIGLENEVHVISIMVEELEHPMWVYII